VSVSSIGEYIREQREQAKISLRQLATAAGVSNPYLSQIERGLRRPSAEILQQIAKGLRISAEALYVQAGILEDRLPDSGVRAAVLAEPGLTERQKQVLLEIFDSFRKETAARTAAATDVVADATAGVDAAADVTALRLAARAGRWQARRLVEGDDDDDDDDPLAGGGPLASGDDAFHGRAREPEDLRPAGDGRPGKDELA
jgi:transcriptional regulator with XRE-family HTH domain